MKTRLVLILLAAALATKAQLFDYTASIETGYFSRKAGVFYDEYNNVILQYSPFYVNLSFTLSTFNLLHLSFENEIPFDKSKSNVYTFKPFYSSYNARIYLTYKNIEAGFFHNCTHPNINNIDYNQWYFGENINKIYIKLKIQ